jgi:transcriptional regulator with XRE-family HTH domain
MASKISTPVEMYGQVKGILKTLGIDQDTLAEKFEMTQASISKALNGGNEKTFLRIIRMLETEYGVTSLNQHLESAVGNDLTIIKDMLQNLQNSVEELRQEVRDLKEKKG